MLDRIIKEVSRSPSFLATQCVFLVIRLPPLVISSRLLRRHRYNREVVISDGDIRYIVGGLLWHAGIAVSLGSCGGVEMFRYPKCGGEEVSQRLIRLIFSCPAIVRLLIMDILTRRVAGVLPGGESCRVKSFRAKKVIFSIAEMMG